VFSRIAERDPLMFVHLGDIHYKNISVNDQDAYRLGIRQSITASPAVDAFRNVALAYIYDDHDFGANNSDSTAPGRPAAAAVYRQATPHYPLAGAGAAYQAWTIGRVRFIMTDLRYERSPNSDTDNASKTMLGATQKAWLKAELLAAKDFPVTVWLNTQIWSVASFVLDDDHWGVFNTERVEISNYLATNGITNVMQLTGDQHALGYKLAADYSTAQTAPMNIYCGASLDSPPLVRGANWDQVDPPGVGRGRYATLTVSDIGTRVTVAWEGWAVDPDTGAESLVMAHDFTVGELGSAVARVWDGRRWVRRNVRTVEDNQWVARPVNA
jgi:alkaline phosphatase D